MVAGGNSVVINAHPAAKEVSTFNINIINEAIIDGGGPKNLITAVKEPTIATAQALMKHPDVKLLVVTGGPGVVKAAMNSGKKVIAAGPGNPPVVVDETADIKKAARDIVAGASFDNNIVCVLEKEIIAVGSITDELKAGMKKCGAYEINDIQARSLADVIIDKLPETENQHGAVNKNFVGKDAKVILKQIGINVADDVRLIITETDKDHPFVTMELLMPVIPIVRVKDADEGIALAKKVEHGNNHTAVMHSKNVENLSNMARICNASIFVKNAPSYAGLGHGAEGYTSFTIASPTGEGLTCVRHFTRERRCSLAGYFRIT
jgi:propionaldehyde dehydrogenase